MLRLLLLLLAALVPIPPTRAALSVDGALTVAVHALVKLKAVGHAPTAAVHWTVTPAAVVDIEELDGRVIFAAPPGEYVVTCRAVRLDGVKTLSETARVKVLVYQPGATPPAKPPAAPPGVAPGAHQDKETAERALCLLMMPGARCTATVVGPRRIDGKWDVFTAAHCMGMVGRVAQIRLQDGRTFGVSRTWIDRASDGCWMVTDDVVADMPFAMMATTTPPPGCAVWQAGFGTTTRRATQRGAVSSGPDARGKLFFGKLPASSGDSGGGIFRADTNELIASMYGTENYITCGCSAVKALPNRPAPATVFSPLPLTVWRYCP